MSQKTEAFIRSIAERFPDISRLLDEHLEDNTGEMLPYVFFGDIVIWLVSQVAKDLHQSADRSRSVVTNLLTLLEKAYREGDEEVQNLISVAFLESLPRRGEDGSAVLDQLGPSLAKQYRLNISAGL